MAGELESNVVEAAAEAPAAKTAPRSPPGSGKGWQLHLGPVTLTSGGTEVKPQFKFGGQAGSFKAEYGIGDVRDGLQFDMNVEGFVEAEAEGHSLDELHEQVRQTVSGGASEAGSKARERARSWGLGAAALERCTGAIDERQQRQWAEAVEAARQTLSTSASSAGSRVTQIAKSLGLDVADLQRLLEDKSEAPMTLRVKAAAGLGLSSKMCLGWRDTDGYHMVGVGTTVSNILSLGGNVFAGKHSSGTSLKLVLGIGNFTFEYVLPAAPRQAAAAAGEPLGAPLAPAAPEQAAGAKPAEAAAASAGA